jgi:hypothetical protein
MADVKRMTIEITQEELLQAIWYAYRFAEWFIHTDDEGNAWRGPQGWLIDQVDFKSEADGAPIVLDLVATDDLAR